MKAIELFAGAGGLGIGICHAGFSPIAVIEWDRYCCDTIRENKERGIEPIKKWPITEGDVKKFDFRPFEDQVDLVSGGPPCQPFSLGGKHQGHADDRDLFPEAVRTIREVRPKAFIFENVKGLTRTTFRNYFEYIKLQMEHPEMCREQDEVWWSHLERLERHHTSGRRDGLQYRVVSLASSRRPRCSTFRRLL